MGQGATDDAIRSLEGAIALDSDDVRADVLLVLVHLREGRKDEALVAAKAFVERKPDSEPPTPSSDEDEPRGSADR